MDERQRNNLLTCAFINAVGSFALVYILETTLLTSVLIGMAFALVTLIGGFAATEGPYE